MRNSLRIAALAGWMGPLLGLYQSAQAQTEKGVGWWSGGVGWQQGQTTLFQNNQEQTALNASLTQGTFWRDQVLIGAELRLSRSRDLTRQGLNFDAVTDSRQLTLSAVPFVRRFWGKEALRGYVGGGLAATYGQSRLLTTNTQQRLSDQENGQWQLAPEFQAGLLYIINTRWGLEVNTRSSLLPLAFTNLNIGLVVLTDVTKKRSVAGDKQPPPQLLTGNWLVGGGFDLSTNQQQLTSGTDRLTTIQRQKTQQFTASPSVGYMLGKRWLVGVAVPIRQQQLTNEFNRSANDVQIGTVLTKSVGIEPFAKKYLSKTRFGPYVAARAGWRTERITGDGAVQSHATGYSWRVSGGLAYLLGQRFLLEGELAEIGSDWSDGDTNGESSRRFDMNATLRPSLTINYVFL